ncbi:helix-turn-helix transcriptional regulator [Rhodopirellula europaea]|uniref:Transcriptional regulator, AlpA family n=1 Tax=Rhodopirellula europaea 6C TaxID=1263867 RepID=M2BAZ0_9BACT|nr:transcriptional regulator, AlpA family [Rhodopirellula europaea 6C]
MKLLKQSEVAERLGFTERYVRSLARQNKIPQPIRIGSRSIRYREKEINEFIANDCRMNKS